jgi:hypothetical protein
MKLCPLKHKRCLIELPKEGQDIVKYINHCNEFKHPFDIEADFESTLLKVIKRDNQNDIEEEEMKEKATPIKNIFLIYLVINIIVFIRKFLNR